MREPSTAGLPAKFVRASARRVFALVRCDVERFWWRTFVAFAVTVSTYLAAREPDIAAFAFVCSFTVGAAVFIGRWVGGWNAEGFGARIPMRDAERLIAGVLSSVALTLPFAALMVAVESKESILVLGLTGLALGLVLALAPPLGYLAFVVGLIALLSGDRFAEAHVLSILAIDFALGVIFVRYRRSISRTWVGLFGKLADVIHWFGGLGSVLVVASRSGTRAWTQLFLSRGLLLPTMYFPFLVMLAVLGLWSDEYDGELIWESFRTVLVLWIGTFGIGALIGLDAFSRRLPARPGTLLASALLVLLVPTAAVLPVWLWGPSAAPGSLLAFGALGVGCLGLLSLLYSMASFAERGTLAICTTFVLLVLVVPASLLMLLREKSWLYLVLLSAAALVELYRSFARVRRGPISDLREVWLHWLVMLGSVVWLTLGANAPMLWRILGK